MIDTQRPQNVVVTSAKHRHMSCSVSVWILVANRRTGDGRTLIGEECGVQAQVRGRNALFLLTNRQTDFRITWA